MEQSALKPGEPQPRQKHKRNLICVSCGHQWASYGYGKTYRCPECYLRKTGKKPGASVERMAELRAMRTQKPPPAALPPAPKPITAAPLPDQPQKEESFLERFLNRPLFGGGKKA